MACPSPSHGLNLEEIEEILQEPVNKNIRICDSGSELDSDEDSVLVEKPLDSEASEADIASDAEDESVCNLQLK
jgi:hypothetical protein